MLRDVDEGLKDFGGEGGPLGGEGFDKGAPGWAVCGEGLCGGREVALEEDGGVVVEGMGENGWGVDPLKAVVGQRQGCEEGGAGGEGVDCGAEVVEEAGKGEWEGAGGTADGGFGFEELDLQAGLGQDDGGREAVGSGADDAGFAGAGWSGGRHAGVWLWSGLDFEVGGVLGGAVDADGFGLVGGLRGGHDVGDEGLRVAVVEGEPGGLDFDHDAMAFEEGVVDGVEAVAEFGGGVGG